MRTAEENEVPMLLFPPAYVIVVIHTDMIQSRTANHDRPFTDSCHSCQSGLWQYVDT